LQNSKFNRVAASFSLRVSFDFAMFQTQAKSLRLPKRDFCNKHGGNPV